jgi:hypothetical protein
MMFGLNAADTLGPLADSGLRDSMVPVEDCARRMGITVDQVQQLVRRGVLRGDRYGFVQPAILSGAVETE